MIFSVGFKRGGMWLTDYLSDRLGMWVGWRAKR